MLQFQCPNYHVMDCLLMVQKKAAPAKTTFKLINQQLSDLRKDLKLLKVDF